MKQNTACSFIILSFATPKDVRCRHVVEKGTNKERGEDAAEVFLAWLAQTGEWISSTAQQTLYLCALTPPEVLIHTARMTRMIAGELLFATSSGMVVS